jgi:peptidoglycan/xylan/chitin deacetylase (PgdA/CDA1 family)
VNTRALLLRLAKLGALTYGAARRERRPGLIILVYHRVGGGTAAQIDLPVELFARQMTLLRERYTLVTLDDVGRGLGTAPGERDVVAVTFDDGYEETFTRAFPILRRHAIPATVYLTTRYIETQQAFDFGAYAHDPRRPRPLTWAQVREMAASGLVTVGAHTHSHADLVRLPPRAVRDEVERCRRLIEERVGVPVRHFAYPWGRMTPDVRRVVGETFATAVRGGCGKNPFGTLDPLALWRQPVQQADGLWFFRLRLGSYLDAEEAFRRIAERVRRGTAVPLGAPPQGRPTV